MTAKTILIVEDNEKNRRLMRDVLQYKGFETIEAGSAEEGIAIAQSSRPDVILLDIQLPGMSGTDAIPILKGDSRTASIPVVAVTASVMTHQEAEIRSLGFDDYQPKPLDIHQFLACVEHHADSRE